MTDVMYMHALRAFPRRYPAIALQQGSHPNSIHLFCGYCTCIYTMHTKMYADWYVWMYITLYECCMQRIFCLADLGMILSTKRYNS